MGTECHGGRGILAGHEMASGNPAGGLVFDYPDQRGVFHFTGASSGNHALTEIIRFTFKTNPITASRTSLHGRSNGGAAAAAGNRTMENRQSPRASDDSTMPGNRFKAGQTYEKTYVLGSQSIFWTKGIKADAEGNRYGSGMLSLELVLLDKMGFDLQKNPYALNETIRILIRTLTPFAVLIGVSFLTRRDDKTMLDRFYVKMKTQVHTDPQEDARQMELSYANTRPL